ncbi:MAG: hypothetical protein OIN84_08330 [Candidatus Methanoperedens sp.]|nr:hypothetical protein [Candidatus Methanoperedens sp. BLZ2]MCX9077967.1 hypothetical protein [Candidatus Methanoperedens sp.]
MEQPVQNFTMHKSNEAKSKKESDRQLIRDILDRRHAVSVILS